MPVELMPVEEVFTRDRSSGRIHKRYRTDEGALISDERCNLDDAGSADEIDQATLEAAESSQLCERCFTPATTDPVVEDGGGAP